MERQRLSSDPWDPMTGHMGMAQRCIHQGRLRLDIKKHFFTKRVDKHWNKILREVVDDLRLSVFERYLDSALPKMLYLLFRSEEVRHSE